VAASTPATCAACPSWAGGQWHDPFAHTDLLVDNNTRLWIVCPETLTGSDRPPLFGYADHARSTSCSFYAEYRVIGGRNGHFDFPASGDHGWPS
jgi:S-formylglutathione hydrolase FrmB